MATAAVKQNASLPGLEVLQGISPEQLAGIVALLQSGLLPGAVPATNSTPLKMDQHVSIPKQDSASSKTLSASTAPRSEIDTIIEMDLDKEDGEVSDFAKDRISIRAPPTGPRNRNESPRGSQGESMDNIREPSHDIQRLNASPRANGIASAAEQHLPSGDSIAQAEAKYAGKCF